METGTLEEGGAAPVQAEPAIPARPDDRPWFELRRSDNLTPEQIGIVRELHRGFAREVSRRAGNALRTLVRVSGTDALQRPYRSFAGAII